MLSSGLYHCAVMWS